MHYQLLNKDHAYHKITISEINSFKKYVPNIQKAFSLTKKHFIGKVKTYVYVVNSREIRSLPITFQNKHFMHLCGVKYVRGSRGFVNDLRKKKLDLQNLYLKNDGSTFQKLEVIDKIDLLDSLSTKVSIGNKMASIHYSNLLRTKSDILGIAVDTDNNGMNSPLSLLNLSIKDSHTLTSFKVVAILEENKTTHVKRCSQIEEHCSEKVKVEIAKLISIS